MTPQNLKKHSETLRWLNKAKPTQIKSFIKTADKHLIKTLCECSLNVLRGNVPISTKQKKKLKRHKTILRKLCNRKLSLKRKKNLLQKGSGLIGALLPTIIPLLGKIIGAF